jgi:hypothetical protein
MKSTGTLMIALATVITVTAAMPVMAANDQTQSAPTKPAQIKHSMMTRHQQHASQQPRESGAVVPHGNAKADFTNANASANTPMKEESMASQLAKTVTMPGNASDPTCKPGTLTALDDGRMHPCQ